MLGLNKKKISDELAVDDHVIKSKETRTITVLGEIAIQPSDRVSVKHTTHDGHSWLELERDDQGYSFRGNNIRLSNVSSDDVRKLANKLNQIADKVDELHAAENTDN